MSTQRASAPVTISIPVDLPLHDLSMARVGLIVMADGLTGRYGCSDRLLKIILPAIDRLTDEILAREPKSTRDLAEQVLCAIRHELTVQEEVLLRLRRTALNVISQAMEDEDAA